MGNVRRKGQIRSLVGRLPTRWLVPGRKWCMDQGKWSTESAPQERVCRQGRPNLVGYLHGYLAVLENGKTRVFQISDGITVGNVTAIYEHRANIWIGGETGLELYREGKFHRIIAANSAALWRISGIVESSDGDLWLNTASGIIRIERSELERSLQNGSYRVAIRQFGNLDGLPGTSAKTRARPTAVQGSDGRIWFSVANGIVWINPAHILKNSISPPVYITDGVANGREYPIGGNIDFPAHTRNIRIAYTGLSYTVPERVKFRYRVEGLECEWEDPGTRREAIYTNLRPGRYHFRVIASNNELRLERGRRSPGFFDRPGILPDDLVLRVLRSRASAFAVGRLSTPNSTLAAAVRDRTGSACQ